MRRWREWWRVRRLRQAFFLLCVAFGAAFPRRPTPEQTADILRKGQEMFRRAGEIGHISEESAAAEIQRLQWMIARL